MKNLFKAVFVLLVFASCSSMDSPDNYQTLNEQSGQPPATPASPVDFDEEHMKKYGKAVPAKMKIDDDPILDLKIIKTADYRFQVKDIDLSTKKIQSLVRENSAYISGMDMNANNFQKDNYITIRVPNVNFEDLLTEIGKEAEFTDYKRIHTEDVSEEYVDIETRLKTKKEVKERYEMMLRTQAKTMTEVFHAEEKIRKLQEEIEAKEGRLRFLKEKVSFSTINLSVYQVIDLEAMAAAKEHGFADEFKENFMTGWTGIMNVLLAMVNIWPLIFIGIVVLFWKRNWFSKITNRKRA